jgi:hypothetical protein
MDSMEFGVLLLEMNQRISQWVTRDAQVQFRTVVRNWICQNLTEVLFEVRGGSRTEPMFESKVQRDTTVSEPVRTCPNRMKSSIIQKPQIQMLADPSGFARFEYHDK